MNMIWTSLLAALVLQGGGATPTPRTPLYLKTSDKILNLKRTGVKADSSRALLDVLAASATTPLNPVESGGGYGIQVGLGGDDFTLVFDTGSSDLWVSRVELETSPYSVSRLASPTFEPMRKIVPASEISANPLPFYL
jgi:hypothetical protein